MIDLDPRLIEKLQQGFSVAEAWDMIRAEEIPEANRCKRCGGTGNQLLSMYQKCVACNGDGVSRGNEHTFKD